MNIWMLLYVSCYVFITNLSYILTFPQKRQKGGIGSAAYDPKQKDIRAFFGGAAVKSSEEGPSESNAEDEANVVIEQEHPSNDMVQFCNVRSK